MMTVREAYIKCKEILADSKIENETFEAICLFEKVTGFDRLGIISHGNEQITEEKLTELLSLVRRRSEHEPLQYILGSWTFCGFDFFVGKGVLIPRDDTEVVVNLCIDYLKNSESKKVIDLCAGSGAISVALEKLAGAEVTALELSDDAFKFLVKNIKLNNTKVKAVKGDVFKAYCDFEDDTFDLIVSNPPYIKSDDIQTLQTEVRQEPRLALDGGKSGYDFYEAIIKNWSSKLRHGGALAFELGENQS
ncbi:MAG: peptide chain release factor N(5)-glutamine methyltransferase, partial [Ruminococcus sp.]|nr:peptide chain release factor N(5)-glutamine methyltransferase [Ruminococcus sp.]